MDQVESEHNFPNSSDNKNEIDELERTDIKLSLAFSQSVTITVLGLYAVAIFKKIDTKHPVFAVIFQEVLVLLALLFFCLMSFLPLMALDYRMWLLIFQGTTMLAVLVHQISWLVVTCLRYHLVFKPQQDNTDDMALLRKISVISVWAMLVPFAAIVGVAVHYTITSLAPRGQDGAGSLEPGELSVYIFAALGVCNFPDILSIFLYILFILQIRKAVNNVVAPNQGVLPGNNIELQEMGVVVQGDNGGLVDHNNQHHLPNGIGNQQALDLDSANEEDHRLTSVKRALGTHASLALLDLILIPSIFLIPDPPLRHFISMNAILILSYWVPIIVVWRNFKKMGEMLKYYFDLIC